MKLIPENIVSRLILLVIRVILKVTGLKNDVFFIKKLEGRERINFQIHALAVNESFGNSTRFTTGVISEVLLKELTEKISSLPIGKIKNALKQKSNSLLLTKVGDTTVQELEKNLVVHPLHELSPKDPIIIKLHKELREIFCDYIASPFGFVNTRCWSSKPSSEKVGPNMLHYDGFCDGHMKIMVYLTPFDNEHGYFQLEKTKINNMPKGTAILFQNSDVKHAGVPGSKFNRISIEVTLMRSFINSPQTNNSHFFGRHFNDPSYLYKSIGIKSFE